ncbi:MAG TPA: DUF418 domain-containing protein [Panacibacter sp.]|nr:DUF418 domain-containing protein [Panacibacter sp.]HNP46615.1 DUF418 domain-containing protein [Panacibacter sp.]
MNSSSPVSQSQRTPIVDMLRGWALFSVVVMNYSTIYSWNNHASDVKADTISAFIETSSEILLGSKGWTLLAVLFGFGFSVLLANISAKGQPVYWFFIKRMLWLFVFAFVNTLFFGGDILNDYAFVGLLLLFFYRLNSRSLYFAALLVLLLSPLLQSYLGRLHLLFAPKDRDRFYALYDLHTFPDHIQANLFMRYKWMLRLSYFIIFHLIQLGCFLTGMALQRSNFFLQLHKKTGLVKAVFFTSLVLSVAFYFLQQAIEKNAWTFNNFYNLYYPQILFTMTCSTTGIMWLYLSGKLKRFFSAMQAYGRLTLTNYLTQNVIAFVLLICIKPDWPLSWYVLTGVVVYILQVYFSVWWTSKYHFGLMEWCWRCLSYGKVFPLKKQAGNRS